MSMHKLPVLMGAAMGLMMMWMLHASHATGATTGQMALFAFVAGHLVLVAVVIAAGIFAARLSPRMRAWMSRLHRPSLGHIGLMAVGMAAGAVVIHLYQHGVGA
ncbi:hypothetical protein [Yoonia sp. 208BN28-4]|uniref:hypothetical protein n=1 Tax=Yoonia sp. 208BN28-4 TaxID=3126505 RepID=UPI0030A72A3F